MAPSDSTKRRTKERGSKDVLDWSDVGAESPQKFCQEGDTVWAEFDFGSDPFQEETENKPANSSKKTKATSSSLEKDDATKQKRSANGAPKKPSRTKSSSSTDSMSEELSVRSSEKRPNEKGKLKKPLRDKPSADDTSKAESKLLKKPSRSKESQSRSSSPSAANRRREKAIENGAAISGTIKNSKSSKSDSRSVGDASLETPSRRRIVPLADLASSRTRAVQRAESRKNWREAHGPSKESSHDGSSHKRGGVGGASSADDALDAKAQKFGRDEHRMSLLDASRKGPIRTSRMRSKRNLYDGDDGDSDNDDDDFSVVSAASSSSFMVTSGLDAPFPNRRVSCAGGYLPSDLSNSAAPTPTRNQGRRASALGSSLDRAQLIYSLKQRDDDTDDDKSCSSSYTLPTGLAGSTNSQFEIGRSSSNVRARRPSFSTPLVMPCVNGSNTDLSTSDHLSRAEKSERKVKVKKSLSMDILSISPAKTSKKNIEKTAEVEDKKSGTSSGAAGTYDSAVDDMLKNRRLRGARGDAPTKKVEEKHLAPSSSRRLSLNILTQFANSNANNEGKTRDAAMRRPSRV
jgi:hypothetical protein